MAAGAQWAPVDETAQWTPVAEKAPEQTAPGFWDTLKREGKAMQGSISGMPAAVYHAFSEPATQEETHKFGGEQEVTGAKRIGLGLHRLLTAPVENAVDWYSEAARGKIPDAYGQALSVIPEALGSAAGSALLTKGTEAAIENAPAAVQALRNAPDAIRSAAKSPAGQVVTAAAKKLPAAAIRRIPYIGDVAADVYNAAKNARPLDATRENVPFAGETEPPTTEAPAAPAPPEAAPKITQKAVEEQLHASLGGQKLVPGVSLRNQPAAMKAATAAKVPEGFTPVDSSALKGYKYDPRTQNFEAISNNGQRYTHAGVTPDMMAAFEGAKSKGAAWNIIRNSPGVDLIEKNGKPVIKSGYRSASPETETEETPGGVIQNEDLTGKLHPNHPQKLANDLFRQQRGTLHGDVNGEPFRFKAGIDDAGNRFVKIYKGNGSRAIHSLPLDEGVNTGLTWQEWAQQNVKNLRTSEELPSRFPTEELTGKLQQSVENVRNLPRDASGKQVRYIYRARDVGEEGIPLTNEHASATSDVRQAMKYAEPGQRSENWGQVVRIDLSKLSPKDYVVKQHPDGPLWIQFTRPLAESEVEHWAGAGKSASK